MTAQLQLTDVEDEVPGLPASLLQISDAAWWEDKPLENGFVSEGEFFVLKDCGGFKLPKETYEKLYDYQRLSVQWLAELVAAKQGGILADDMGLGKTIQLAACMYGLWTSKIGHHFLVAVPVTLIDNWKKELATWCPGMPVHVLYGTENQRYEALNNVYKKGGVLLTSYDLLFNIRDEIVTVIKPKEKAGKRKKKERDEAFADELDADKENENPLVEMQENHPWDFIVLDEAHRVKNASSKAARAMRMVKGKSRILLSGTPLQNKLQELWSLMDICMPALLGNRQTFEQRFAEPIAAGLRRDATPYAVQLKDQLSRQLKSIVAPHFLRRTKDGVEEMRTLPEKKDIVVWLKFTPEQERLYKLLLESDAVKQARTYTAVNGTAVFRAIRLVQKMCNHPLLSLPDKQYFELFENWGSDEKEKEEDNLVDKEEWDTLELTKLIPKSPAGAVELSCKLRFLQALLPALHKEGHRVLIYSQSTKMLNLVQSCVLRPLELKFLRMDGSQKKAERTSKVARFESADGLKFFAMCLSISVGGQGLTLTSADRVILLDPSWNPAIDMQAIDRAHRLGQTKTVVVYRLFGTGCIEDKMFRSQTFKRGLVNTLLEEENQARHFTKKDMQSLFTYGDKTHTLLQEKGYDLESGEILHTVQSDVGGIEENTDFWKLSELEGFADYSRVFSQLEDVDATEDDTEAAQNALDAIKSLLEEEYVAEPDNSDCESPKVKKRKTEEQE